MSGRLSLIGAHHGLAGVAHGERDALVGEGLGDVLEDPVGVGGDEDAGHGQQR